MTSVFRFLWYDRWLNLAVMFGVLCAAAVLTGALLTGDSMRYSLKALTLDRLGKVHTILFAPNFIEEQTVQQSMQQDNAVPVIYLSGAVEYNGKVSPTQILALPKNNALTSLPFSVAVNQVLADKLQMKSGGELSLRFLSPQSIPPESTFGRRDNMTRSRITVDTVLPNTGIGRFSLKADQQAEPLLLMPLEELQEELGVGNKVNALFYTDKPKNFTETFKPTLDDLGIVINGSDEDNMRYITSKRMLFNDAQAAVLQTTLKKATLQTAAAGEPGLLYLASSIKALKNDKETPYSTVLAINGGLNLKENEIALNQWTADDLGVQRGDEIELTWFEPDNVNVTKKQSFILETIIPNEQYPDGIVPNVQGFTDEESIADWDPPFPFDAKKIRQKDEDYWDTYRAAPKAFVSLKTGQQHWGSRFGSVSLFVTKDLSEEAFHQELFADSVLPIFNLSLVPVKEQGLAASLGTTPFSVLFLCFSFFIIASALMLVMLLFRLSIEVKAKQIGIRLACGWTRGQVLRHYLAEGFVIAVAGSFFGVLLGILYALLMIHGLTTWWVDAVSVPFLTLSINPSSLLIGFIGTLTATLLTVIVTLRYGKRIPVKTLLGGDYIVHTKPKKKKFSQQK